MTSVGTKADAARAVDADFDDVYPSGVIQRSSLAPGPGAPLASIADAKLLGRHQIAAGIGTSADFATMIALVELAHLSPAVATVLSATAGGVVNFLVSRRWAFAGRHAGTVSSQALRYAAVSFGGALLNAGLLALTLRAVDIAYPFARAAVAIAVSLFYTYPLHARVVFRVAPRTGPARTRSENSSEAKNLEEVGRGAKPRTRKALP